MTIEAIGSIGELIAAVATVATLFYLATQIRHGTEATRATSQQALLDTFFDSGWELAQDMELAHVVGAGLVSFESLSDREKTAFSLILLRYVGNLEKGLRLRESGLIDEATLDSVGRNLVASIKAPGGAQWWKISGGVVSPMIVEYIERGLKDTSIPSWDEQLPFWGRWASESQPAQSESGNDPGA